MLKIDEIVKTFKTDKIVKTDETDELVKIACGTVRACDVTGWHDMHDDVPRSHVHDITCACDGSTMRCARSWYAPSLALDRGCVCVMWLPAFDVICRVCTCVRTWSRLIAKSETSIQNKNAWTCAKTIEWHVEPHEHQTTVGLQLVARLSQF